jgi:ribonuclease D
MNRNATNAETEDDGLASLEEKLTKPWPALFGKTLPAGASGGESELETLQDLRKEIEKRLLKADPASDVARQLATMQLAVNSRLAKVTAYLHQIWRMHLDLTSHEYKAPLVAKAVRPERSGRRNSSKSELIRARLVFLLREKGPTHRAELLDQLISEGLMVREKSAMNRLATILSDSKHLFGSLGGGVFTLRVDEPQQQQAWVEAAPLSEGPPRSSASNSHRKGGHNPCDAVTPAS